MCTGQILLFNLGIGALQRCTAKWISCKYTHVPFFLSPPYAPSCPSRSSQSPELSFLLCSSFPRAVLHMAVHICQYQSPDSPHHPTPAPCVPRPFSASAESTFFLCPFVCCEGPGRSMHCSHWRAVVKLPRPSLPRLQWINEKSR